MTVSVPQDSDVQSHKQSCAMVPPTSPRPCHVMSFGLVFRLEAAVQKCRGGRKRCGPGQRQRLCHPCPLPHPPDLPCLWHSFGILMQCYVQERPPSAGLPLFHAWRGAEEVNYVYVTERSRGVYRIEPRPRKRLEGLIPADIETVSIPGCHYSARDAAMALTKCASLLYILVYANMDMCTSSHIESCWTWTFCWQQGGEASRVPDCCVVR